MLAWILALLGIVASFLVKYINKKDKKTTLSIPFWFKDNIAEVLVSVIFMIILMIIASNSEFDNEVIESIPLIKSLPMDLIAATGLAANTTYYVRAYAVNSEGTAYGANESFTTPTRSTATNGTNVLVDDNGNLIIIQ